MPRSSARRKSDDTKPIELHPTFSKRMEDFVESLSVCKGQVREAIEDYDRTLKEIAAYLDYEIDRLGLEIEKMEWASKSPPKEIEACKERRNLLAAARRMVDEKITGTQDLMTAFIDILKRIAQT